MQVEQERKAVAKQLLTPQAYERLMNVRVANYTLYTQLIELLIAMTRNKKVYGKMTEEQLKDLLEKLTFKPRTDIVYKHK